jgi:MFS family permease
VRGRDTEGVTDSLATVFHPAAHLGAAPLLDTPTGHPIGIPTAFAALVVFFVLLFLLMVLVGHLRDRHGRR